MPKQRMSSQIAELRQKLTIEESQHRATCARLITLEQRLKEIAAESESLRMDKKWLQQMHSNLLQSMRFSGPKVL